MADRWIDAGPAAALVEGQALCVAVGRMTVAVVRSGAEVFAIQDLCTHDGGELAGGPVEGAEIVCPRHGARFCLRTGAALSPPACEAVRVFETKTTDGRVWVRSG